MQKLLNVVLTLAVVALTGVVAVLWQDRSAPAPVTDAVALAPAEFNAAVETALLENPRILQQVSAALETELAAEEAVATRTALAGLTDAIYDDPANVVLGNPEGTVTLVELFDYNCTYCRQVVPDVLELIAENPDLRVILREFPILSEGSVAAARVALLVNRSGVDYSQFHVALMSARGTIDGAAALDAAATLGLDRATLAAELNAADVTAALERTYAIASELGLTGTPTFIIGNEVIPGALDKSELETRIAALRECGEATCPPAEG